MKIEIWSDVVCPFCYIGKRVFERALAQLPYSDEIDVVWKSFQLDPTMPTDAAMNHLEHLSEKKNISLAQAREMFDFVTQRAKEEGLNYNLHQSISTNSFRAHVLIQFAKEKGKGDEIEEVLFKAFFIDGKNIGDIHTLVQLGEEIGLNKEEIITIFDNDKYAYEVKSDIEEARQIGVTGVPFFVLDRKYAISGAQPEEAFLQTIQKAFEEWKENQKGKPLNIIEGNSCSVDGECN